MAPREAISLDALRARVRELEGAHVVTRRVPIGVEAVDARLGGLPRPGLVELCGPDGSGRHRLACAWAAALTARREAVAWADLARELYPPGVLQHGVSARHLLVVRPAHDRAEWAVEQLLRAGCFSLVIVTGAIPGGRAGPRWARAAEHGHSTALVVQDQPDRRLPATVRLAVDGEALLVTRDRAGGVPGRSAPLPPWPIAADPWAEASPLPGAAPAPRPGEPPSRLRRAG